MQKDLPQPRTVAVCLSVCLSVRQHVPVGQVIDKLLSLVEVGGESNNFFTRTVFEAWFCYSTEDYFSHFLQYFELNAVCLLVCMFVNCIFMVIFNL